MIYFYVYPSAFQNPGGGEILLLKTREYLEKANVPVKLFDMWQDRIKPGDIFHVFGSVKEALGMMQTAKSKGAKIVHCPIIWYNWQSSLAVPYPAKERLMAVVRQAAKSFFSAIPSERRSMMCLADRVLGGSQAEAEQIHRYFLIPRDKTRVVTYGVDALYEQGNRSLFEEQFKLKDFILMVGRIEPRKNQLKLIRALKGSGKDLVIAGSPVSWHNDYYEKCQRESDSRVHWIGPLEKDSALLRAAYAACNVFVLPSWFETPGLAAMEAALAGAKVVITREGATQEYFGREAAYVNPASEKDIRDKVLSACAAIKTDGLQRRMREKFLWADSAQQNLRVYQELGYALNKD